MSETSPLRTEELALPGGLIPVDQWALPDVSVHRSLKDALRHLVRQLGAGVASEEEPFASLDDLPDLSKAQAKRLAPKPDLAERARAIDYYLQLERSEGAISRAVTFLVAPPFFGVKSALQHFPELEATTVGDTPEAWTVIRPPENLLLDDKAAGEWWDQQDLSGHWVIPELADFWLRHRAGLALVRELLRRIGGGDVGHGVVGCSSWCWQFWTNYLPDAYMAPWMPAPMSAERLGGWLEYLAAGRQARQITARMANNGLYVLPVKPPADGAKRKHSNFLRDLVVTARGNPGVALAIWQRSLRARPEDNAETEDDAEASNQASAQSCWVVPLDQLNLPAMPQSRGSVLGFVLHALLLHDGLDRERLALVTGIPAHELNLVLSRLERAELIEADAAAPSWRVTALGYPTVKRHLQGWGFPVDGF